MKRCPECGGEVQDAHSFCPSCNEPISSAAQATSRDQSSESGGSGTSGAADSDGLSRRQYALYGGATLAAAVGGSGVGYLALSGSGGGPGDPAETARTYLEHVDQGNFEEANEMVHEESPQRINESNAGLLSTANITIDSTEVVSENDTNAEVDIEFTVTALGQSETTSSTAVLQTQDGEWKVLRGAGSATSG